MSTPVSVVVYWDAVTALVGRELRIRYKGSILGLAWAVLSPLGTAAIMYLVFGRILRLSIPHYAAFVYGGLLPWTWFQSTVHNAATTLNDNRDLVRRPFFPRAVLPAVVTGTNFLLYLLALPVMLVLLVVDGVALSPWLLLLPLLWLVQAVFTLAVAVLIAALGVVIRDAQHLLGVVMLLWFYLTPVFYSLEGIAPEHARWFALNPMAALVGAHRALTLYGQPPDWSALAAVTVVALALLCAGLALFRALQDVFVEEV